MRRETKDLCVTTNNVLYTQFITKFWCEICHKWMPFEQTNFLSCFRHTKQIYTKKRATKTFFPFPKRISLTRRHFSPLVRRITFVANVSVSRELRTVCKKFIHKWRSLYETTFSLYCIYFWILHRVDNTNG